jgi:hypothetical protein
MYNLLVTSAEGAWDNPFYEFDRSRFLEYTADKVTATLTSLKGLSEKQIDLIKSLPCLFAYEGFNGSVRVGRITSIKERGRNILIEYEFHPTIETLDPQKIEEISPLLDIREWEMNRTHWAIKEENLLERLKAANLVSKDVAEWKQKHATTNKSVESRPQASRVTTVQGFIVKVLADKAKEGVEIFYRGHSDKKKYKLEPSLFRKDESGNYMYLHNEHILYRELIISNSQDFSSDEYTLDRLVRMQHYSLPTRLLDITSNPLIALYFACKSKYGKKVDGKYIDEDEGEIILFTLQREQVKYFDSDTASCIANLARLPKSEKNKIDLTIENEKSFNEQPAIKRLTHFIKEEKPFFEHKIIPSDMRKIICVKSKKSNDRIHSQSGAFLLFGLDAVLDEKGTPEINVSRISVSNKAAILDELDLLNINESTVFPYIENSAKYVAQKYAFRPPEKI